MKKKEEEKAEFDSRTLFGVLVILVGVGLLLQNIFAWFTFNYVWPIIIIAVGAFLVLRKK